MHLNINLEHVLFLDIETVPQYPDFDLLDDEWKNLWEEKSKFFRERDGLSVHESYARAGIYAEFGKIVCISVGSVARIRGQRTLLTQSFYGESESVLLREFGRFLNGKYNHHEARLCAHNGKEFDFPYIARRMLVRGIRLPEILDTAGKKPWEVRHFDTMNLWKFGDYKHYTSLKLLTKIFGIPSPKDDLDGSMVGPTFWVDSDLDRIESYCRRDVEALCKLFLSYLGELKSEPLEVVQDGCGMGNTV